MKFITFDSSTKALSVALAEGELPTDFTLKASTTTLGKRQHGQTLAPAVENILKQIDWKMSDIDAIIVGNGPGSYTGLRIGVTFAKVWANATKLPLYSVSSLALMAGSASKQTDFVLPIMDARRQTAYTALYQYDNQAVLQAVEHDQHIKFEEFLAKIKKHINPNSELTLIGTDIDEFVEMASRQLPTTKLIVIDDWNAYPHTVHAFGKVPWMQIEEPTLLAPNYAHATLAEQEWAEKSDSDTLNPDELIDFK